MIIKSFELPKIDLEKKQFFLFYGDNEGLKEEIIKNLFEKNYIDKIFRYEEKEVIENLDDFFNNILNKLCFGKRTARLFCLLFTNLEIFEFFLSLST